jgi:hypothetical protein
MNGTNAAGIAFLRMKRKADGGPSTIAAGEAAEASTPRD